VERFTQFLTIVGLTALLVGGVGVGNAVKSHLDRRRETIATMKALGASGRRVFAVYLTQVLLLAAVGGAIGMMLGAKIGARLLTVLKASVIRRLVIGMLVFAGGRALMVGLGIGG